MRKYKEQCCAGCSDFLPLERFDSSQVGVAKPLCITCQSKINQGNRQTQKNFNGGSFTEREWNELKEKYNHRCVRCGHLDGAELKSQYDDIPKRKVKIVPDHIIPVSKGGTNYITNIQPLCQRCNSSKGTKTVDYRF